jgi:putative nucleotidyltransferase-like protein
MDLNFPTTEVSTPLDWENRIPDTEWQVYRRVIEEARAAGIRFAFGGAFATAVYTGELRNTKDFDFYILPEDREAMVGAISRAGLQDHYDRLPYDRAWIYRASQDESIVDAIWTMANQRAEVDLRWLTRGPEVSIRGQQLRSLPVEELIWSKLYVLQRDRTDWGDVLRLLDARAHSIDWSHLLSRLAEDTPLLTGALSVLSWLAPDRVREIPESVWDRIGLRPPEPAHDPHLAQARADLLDSRPWFRT